MSQKVSTLPELTNGNLSDADLLYVVDTSEANSKKLLSSSIYTYTLNKLQNANKLLPDLPADASVFLNGTGVFSESVTEVTGVSPVAVVNGTTTPQISMSLAQSDTDGYLRWEDWNIFNNKQAALVSGTTIKTVNGDILLGAGDVSVGVTSVTGSAPIVSSGGATPNLSISQATTSVNGYLTSTDWNTFNSKQDLKTIVNESAPITTAKGIHINECVVLTNISGTTKYDLDAGFDSETAVKDEVMVIFLGATSLVTSSPSVTLNGVNNNTAGVTITQYKPTLIKKIATATYVVG